jgi:hypothetical protein
VPGHVNRQATIVLLIFLVAVTPSLSDAVQINDQRPGAWVWVAVWYAVLLCFLAREWRSLA